MGTRADFYVGRGEDAEWIGSIGWDGYPDGLTPTSDKPDPDWPPSLGAAPKLSEEWEPGRSLVEATTEDAFRERVERFFRNRSDVSRPKDGWPWPWENSATTDYAYAFDGGKVWASSFGHAWFDASEDEPEDAHNGAKDAVFPHMKERQAVTFGPRSGLMVFGIKTGT